VAGEHARQGVQLAVNEARAGGGGPGGRPLQAFHADTRGEADVVEAEAVRLLKVNQVVALLGGPQAASVRPLLRAAEPYGVPVVVPGELPEGAAGAGLRALGAPPEDRGRALAEHLGAQYKTARAAVLIDGRDPVAPAVAAAFLKEWRRGGRKAEEWTYTAPADRAELAGRAARAGAEVVVLACPAWDFDFFRARLGEVGARPALAYAGEDIGDTPLRGRGEGGPEVFLATAFSAGKLTEQGQAFARRYEADFHEPPDLYAAGAYDGARLLFEVLRRSLSTAADKVAAELARTDHFDSVTGPVTWKDGRARRPVFVIRLKDGTATVVRTAGPTPQG
jgi:branched-chain amino acid transport system substrate-binding protein